MAIRCSSRKPVQSVIHWPAVNTAGGVAFFMVFVSMAAIFAHGQSVSWDKKRWLTPSEVSSASSPAMAVAAEKSEIHSTKSETNSKHEIPNEESLPSKGISQYREAIAALSPMPMPVHLPDPGKGELADKNAQGSCQSSDSVLEFARDPMEAARLAREEHKLMFVLHVSGNFEESKFT
jgi:hypothetical protein